MAKKTVQRLMMAALGVFVFVTVAAAQQAPAPPSPAKRDEQKRVWYSYAIGVEMLRNLKRQGFDYDLDTVIKGMKDAAAGGRLMMPEEDLKTTMSMAASEARRKKALKRLAAGQDNRKEGEAFLAENKKKEGVVELPSGLQYKIVKEGDGKKPVDSDTVQLIVRASHLDGTQVDSSYSSGAPTVIKVSETIPGWREALKLMPAGSTWELYVPPTLAYGQRGSGQIGPYETIIYEIELEEIK